ncbi:PEP-CTERM sorting domain-containing protein [Nitrosospira sp. Nsp11]|uniref:PEP-CTERM sorting domain-containing protein n=1 Tax=Nitrosospira sp. Nsp11 TaxID=1855338 RepID=UPI0021153F00|nr:PEP-CTERM sorting domain-containing protein [Nitrosospira sp. Nsp11]
MKGLYRYFLHHARLRILLWDYSWRPYLGRPEPQTYAMFLAGLGLMCFMGRRRKHYHAH